MNPDDESVALHYRRADVRETIAAFCRNRWVALHCAAAGIGGRPRMVRYRLGSAGPLTLSTAQEVALLMSEFRRLKPRAIYATAHEYRRLASAEDVRDPLNLSSSMPTWDVDVKGGSWMDAVEAASVLVGELDRLGVSRSVFVKWSGRGVHVHLHGRAFSREIIGRVGALDCAYAVTEFLRSRLAGKVKGVNVENRIDPQRVFTSPLSLHRELDRVCVCLDPSNLRAFHPDWARPGAFRHYPGWAAWEEGEADGLAELAYRAVGPYPFKARPRRRAHPPLDAHIRKAQRRLQ